MGVVPRRARSAYDRSASSYCPVLRRLRRRRRSGVRCDRQGPGAFPADLRETAARARGMACPIAMNADRELRAPFKAFRNGAFAET
jgi:hypothetical protein